MIKKFRNSIVEYNPETGIFIWIDCYKKPWMNDQTATREFSNGYLFVKADGKHHMASRLAWELINGPIPDKLEIDHINRNKKDNRITNLRAVTRKENLANSIKRPGSTGLLGISIYTRPSGNGILYRTRKGGKVKYYQTLDEAIAGYAKLASKACKDG